MDFDGTTDIKRTNGEETAGLGMSLRPRYARSRTAGHCYARSSTAGYGAVRRQIRVFRCGECRAARGIRVGRDGRRSDD